MAYRIRLHEIGTKDRLDDIEGPSPSDVVFAIQEKTKDTFRIGTFDHVGFVQGRGPKGGSGKPGYVLDLRQIRLAKPKPYCGNHPGSCVAGGPRTKAGLKRAARFLEWEDWIKFHTHVNDVLDRFGVSADISTRGADVDVGQLLWCRRGISRRVRYDWVQTSGGMHPTRPVNHGTPDQFSSVVFQELRIAELDTSHTLLNGRRIG